MDLFDSTILLWLPNFPLQHFKNIQERLSPVAGILPPKPHLRLLRGMDLSRYGILKDNRAC